MTNNTATAATEQTTEQLEAAYSSTTNHSRDLAEEMLRIGEIDENSTIADAKAALERHYTIEQ